MSKTFTTKKLTVIEALSQGYFKCGEEGDSQGTIDITDSGIIDFTNNVYFLAERQPCYVNVTADELQIAIMDILYDKVQQLHLPLKFADHGMYGFDWTSMADDVSRFIYIQPYYPLTKIRLVSDSQR